MNLPDLIESPNTVNNADESGKIRISLNLACYPFAVFRYVPGIPNFVPDLECTVVARGLSVILCVPFGEVPQPCPDTDRRREPVVPL